MLLLILPAISFGKTRFSMAVASSVFDVKVTAGPLPRCPCAMARHPQYRTQARVARFRVDLARSKPETSTVSEIWTFSLFCCIAA